MVSMVKSAYGQMSRKRLNTLGDPKQAEAALAFIRIKAYAVVAYD